MSNIEVDAINMNITNFNDDLARTNALIKSHKDIIDEENKKCELRLKDLDAFNFNGINNEEMREQFKSLYENADHDTRYLVLAAMKQTVIDHRDKNIKVHKEIIEEYKEEYKNNEKRLNGLLKLKIICKNHNNSIFKSNFRKRMHF